ncbi:MAG TPA: nuclease-related domain-containing protein [Microbacteriaceae bacterium]
MDSLDDVAAPHPNAEIMPAPIPIASATPMSEVVSNLPSLAGRFAGQSVMEELLREQATRSPRSAMARFWGRSPLSDDARAWYVGALGERAMGRLLGALDDSWTVIHAVPVGVGTSDIDHVVIGPGGVFTINTKHHSGKPIWVAGTTFLVSGQKQPYIRNSEHEATRATKLLRAALPSGAKTLPVGVDAVPLIALIDPRTLTIKKPPSHVIVRDARTLVRWLRKRPVVLDTNQVAVVGAAALQPQTWHGAPTRGPERAVTIAGFERLDREVRSARSRRRLWALVGAIVMIAALFTVVPLAVQAIFNALLGVG